MNVEFISCIHVLLGMLVVGGFLLSIHPVGKDVGMYGANCPLSELPSPFTSIIPG